MQAKEQSLSITKNGRSQTLTFGELLGVGGKNQRRVAGLNLDQIEKEYPLLQITIADLEDANAENLGC